MFEIYATYIHRHKNMLILPTFRITSHTNNPYVMSIKIFSKLTQWKIKQLTFMNKFKQVLIKKPYYTIN